GARRPKAQLWVGAPSHFYTFGRLCFAGLTGRPDPDTADRILLPEQWQRLLDELTAWVIDKRPSHAGMVLDPLAATPGAGTLISQIERDLPATTIGELPRQRGAEPTDLAALLKRAN